MEYAGDCLPAFYLDICFPIGLGELDDDLVVLAVVDLHRTALSVAFFDDHEGRDGRLHRIEVFFCYERGVSADRQDVARTHFKGEAFVVGMASVDLVLWYRLDCSDEEGDADMLSYQGRADAEFCMLLKATEIVSVESAATFDLHRESSLAFSDQLLKSFIFSILIALVSCHQGLSVSGGADAVGKATTQAVVISIVLIIVVDCLATAVIYYALPT